MGAIRGIRQRFLVSVVLVVSAFIGLAAAVDDRPARDRARDWAVGMAGSVPSTVEELALLPLEYRMAAFAEMTPTEKSTLFREQIEPLTRRGTFTQRQVASGIYSALAPEAYTDEGRKAAQAQLAPLCTQLRTVFDKDEWALFGSIAPGGNPRASFGDLLRSAKGSLVSLPVLAAAHTPASRAECECAVGSGCQIACILDGGKICQSSGCSTPPWYSNFCGCGLVWDCDGTCQIILPG